MSNESWRTRAVVSLGAALLSAQAFAATLVQVCPTCTTEAQVHNYAYTWGMANIQQHYAVFVVTSPAPYAIQKCFQRINTYSPPYVVNTVVLMPSMASCPNPGPPLG
jgi:hypothetical protein